MIVALLVASADPRRRSVVYIAALVIVILIISLVDRGIEVGAFSKFQYGNWLQPEVITASLCTSSPRTRRL